METHGVCIRIKDEKVERNDIHRYEESDHFEEEFSHNTDEALFDFVLFWWLG